MFNGTTTFAAIRQKQPNKHQQTAPYYTPISFQAIKEAQQKASPFASHEKTLQNQENQHQNHPWMPSSQRKPLLHSDKPNRKPTIRPNLGKSPSHSPLTNHPLFKKDSVPTPITNTSGPFKPSSGYKSSASFMTKTPHLSKVNNSFMTDEGNASFMTEKGMRADGSEHGSVSASSKASFNDSFQLPLDVSYEEEDRHSM